MPETPAELAANEAQRIVAERIDAGTSFILEAGAGAGKTYSLVKSLIHVNKSRGSQLERSGKRIACVTFTNIAAQQINERVGSNSRVSCSTIHSFCWSLISRFQNDLRADLRNVHEKWNELLDEVGGAIGNRRITYSDIGRRIIEDASASLHHDDVLAFFARFAAMPKFARLFVSQYPVLFVDEYQDTNEDVAEAIKSHLLPLRSPPLVGLFGDHWQQIYSGSCGRVDDARLAVINKGANFRSAPAVVSFLNNMRPELPQAVADPEARGEVRVFHTNQWPDARRAGQHWAGDLPLEASDRALALLRQKLVVEGWNFEDGSSKILMLTRNSIASRNGFSDLVEVFKDKDRVFERYDPHVKFFSEIVEPVCQAFAKKRFGDLFDILGAAGGNVQVGVRKGVWAAELNKLSERRHVSTIEEVMTLLKSVTCISVPDGVLDRERAFERATAANDAAALAELDYIPRLYAVPYAQVVTACQYIDEKTPFSTKHGVKGAEFENVLVVCGRGWNLYNFGEFLSQASEQIPVGRQAAFERNRNLFYVSCSRPKSRLAILFTQQLSGGAMATLQNWCGREAIIEL